MGRAAAGVRAVPVGLMGGAVVWDFIGMLTGERLLHTTAWCLLGLGLAVGVALAVFHLVQMVRATGAGSVRKVAWMYPLAQLASIGLVVGAVLTRPRTQAELPSVSMALAVVGLGLWLIAEQLREELLRPAPKAQQRRDRPPLRLVHSR